MQRTMPNKYSGVWKLKGYFFIPTAILSGMALAVISRLWMRWISTNPEFSWSGTLGIIFIITIFFTIQSLLFLAHRNHKSRLLVGILRFLALFFTLPLFAAAGAWMFPTVFLAALAAWRRDWPNRLRLTLGVAAFAWTGFVVQFNIIKNFGWNLESIGQTATLIIIYLIIIRLIKGAVAARTEFI